MAAAGRGQWPVVRPMVVAGSGGGSMPQGMMWVACSGARAVLLSLLAMGHVTPVMPM